MKEEKKKWVMPKFLPYKYDVKLINEDKVYMHIYVMKALVFLFYCALTLISFFPLHSICCFTGDQRRPRRQPLSNRASPHQGDYALFHPPQSPEAGYGGELPLGG